MHLEDYDVIQLSHAQSLIGKSHAITSSLRICASSAKVHDCRTTSGAFQIISTITVHGIVECTPPLHKQCGRLHAAQGETSISKDQIHAKLSTYNNYIPGGVCRYSSN